MYNTPGLLWIRNWTVLYIKRYSMSTYTGVTCTLQTSETVRFLAHPVYIGYFSAFQHMLISSRIKIDWRRVGRRLASLISLDVCQPASRALIGYSREPSTPKTMDSVSSRPLREFFAADSCATSPYCARRFLCSLLLGK